MRKRNQRNHCSDDVLLAHADSELPVHEESWVATHLSECWECRARLEELENTAQTLARLVAANRFGWPDRTAASRAAFDAWKRGFEHELASRQPTLQRVHSLRSWALSAVPEFARMGRRVAGSGLAALMAFPLIALAGLGSWYYAGHLIVESPDMEAPARETVRRLRPVPPVLPVVPGPSRIEPTAPTPEMVPVLPEVEEPPLPDMRAKEIEVLYALHRVHACVEDSIEVVPTPAGGLLVRGITSTRERRAQLLAVLEELADPQWLETDIRTVAEGVSAFPQILEQATQPEIAAAPFGGDNLHFREDLVRYFAEHGQAEATSLAIDFANRAVSSSDSLLSEAWALRRLALRFGPQELHQLRPQSVWLVEMMARDHLAALREEVTAVRAALEPPFTAIAGPLTETGSAAELMHGRQWGEWSLEALEIAQQIRRYTIGLFAGAGLPVVPEADRLRVRVKTPEETLQDLRAALASLDAGVRSAEEGMETEYPGRISRH